MGHTCQAMGESNASFEGLEDLVPSALVPEVQGLLGGARLLVVQGNPVLTDGLVQHLRVLGCVVGVTDVAGRGLSRLDFLDPHVVLFDREQAEDDAGVLQRLTTNPRLRWATVLDGFSWEATWPSFASAPDLVALGERVAPLMETDRQIRLLAAGSEAFTVPVHQIGPARVLRALAGVSGDVLRLMLRTGAARATVEVCGELVVGATHRDHPGGPLRTGTVALASVLALGTGHGEVVRCELGSTMTIMSPVALALDAAQVELAQPEVVETKPTHQRELDDLIAASHGLGRPSMDGHPAFELGEEEVTAKSESWEEGTAQVTPDGAASATGDTDTTRRIALSVDGHSAAKEQLTAPETPKDAPSASSRRSEPEAAPHLPIPRSPFEPSPVVDVAPGELPTPVAPVSIEALDPESWTEPELPPAIVSTPPVAPPHADAVGAHPAVEVRTSGKAAWYGAGVLLSVAAVVGGLLAVQGGQPSGASSEEGPAASVSVAVVEGATPTPHELAESPRLARTEDAVVPQVRPSVASEDEGGGAFGEATSESNDGRPTVPVSEDAMGDADPSEMPVAPAVFGPRDVEGGTDRARSDALLAAAAAARVRHRLRYLYAAARADRRNPHVAEALARHFLDVRGPAAAEPWAREAVRLRRRRSRYRLLLGDVLRAAGDVAGARRAYEEAVELGGTDEGRARLLELGPS